MSNYTKRTWLNPKRSSSTGSVVCFDGKTTYRGEQSDYRYLEISDCNNKITLHQGDDDTTKDFVKKMKLLKSEIDLFINHLEQNT